MVVVFIDVSLPGGGKETVRYSTKRLIKDPKAVKVRGKARARIIARSDNSLPGKFVLMMVDKSKYIFDVKTGKILSEGVDK